MNVDGTPHRTVWRDGRRVMLIDQTKLPHRFEIAPQATHRDTAVAIKTMIVRGAGAIGATAGFAMAQAAMEAPRDQFLAYVEEASTTIQNTRPTAQNLFYAVNRVMKAIRGALPSVDDAVEAACKAAQEIADEDALACKAIGANGAPFMKRLDDGPGPVRISTHCNAGWLAFVDWGSALSPVYTAQRKGQDVFVFVDETRPRGQGASLTTWELGQEGVPHRLIVDCATGYFYSSGQVDVVIVGSDRIAANGDVANKIGTYTRAVIAHANGIPFYVAAPTSTIDPNCKSGDQIPIEERGEDEVTHVYGMSDDFEMTRVRVTGESVRARNPAFDVTPAKYIAGIITEVGIVPASPQGMADALSRAGRRDEVSMGAP